MELIQMFSDHWERFYLAPGRKEVDVYVALYRTDSGYLAQVELARDDGDSELFLEFRARTKRKLWRRMARHGNDLLTFFAKNHQEYRVVVD